MGRAIRPVFRPEVEELVTLSNLGGFIRSLREQCGISVRALAARAGISHTAICNWESGQFFPRMQELTQVLDALGASAEQQRQALELTHRPRALAQIRRSRRSGDTAAGGVPVTQGDLLRALRVRRHRTLDMVASQIGVSIRTVSRWERGENQPDLAQIHAVCRALGATPEEVGLLTVAAAPWHATARQGTVLEELETQFLKAWSIPCTPESASLLELTFISLAARIQPLAWEDIDARRLLSQTYTSLANYYHLNDRSGRVSAFADRALELASGIPAALGMSTLAAIRHASVLPKPAQSRQLLEQWLPRLPHPAWQAWILSEIANLASRSGQQAEAEVISLRSLELASRYDSNELAARRMDRAELLAEWGKAEESYSLLPAVIPGTSAHISLAWAKVSMLSGNYDLADQMVRQTHQTLEARADDRADLIPYLLRKVNAIDAALPR